LAKPRDGEIFAAKIGSFWLSQEIWPD
jgi:hypothetical protein